MIATIAIIVFILAMTVCAVAPLAADMSRLDELHNENNDNDGPCK